MKVLKKTIFIAYIGKAPNRKHAKRRACDEFLNAYKEYRDQRDKSQKAIAQKEKEVKPTLHEIRTGFINVFKSICGRQL